MKALLKMSRMCTAAHVILYNRLNLYNSLSAVSKNVFIAGKVVPTHLTSRLLLYFGFWCVGREVAGVCSFSFVSLFAEYTV